MEHMNENASKERRTTPARRVITRFAIPFVVGLAVGLLLWAVLGEKHPSREETTDFSPVRELTREAGESTLWTCSMHPQIRLPNSGKCPICFMDLIPVFSDTTAGAGPRQFVMSESAMKLAEIETVPVERKYVTKTIRMVGKVEYDERRLAHITSYVSGRIDRLYVDYTGIPVRKGDHMVLLYSPELLSAQQELLQAGESLKKLGDSAEGIVAEITRATLVAAREKLRLWGLTDKQVKEIERRGTVVDHLTIYAPLGGVVIEKNASEGMYVKTGARIYSIADLSQVWVKVDAYESDLEWVRYGQEVEFTTEAYSGETFTGKIAFIDPFLSERTRSVKVRINVSNGDGKLKPGMFVRGLVKSQIASGGKALSPSLAGKWISPMHPEIVKDQPGACDICGMPLEPAENLGLVSAEKSEPPLAIPKTAPLITGARAVVYVKMPGTERPTYEGREIILGPRGDDYYVVQSGLAEGEHVVVHGSFKIDSALQIQAKPSMMNPEGGAPAADHHGSHVMDASLPASEGTAHIEIPAAPVTKGRVDDK